MRRPLGFAVLGGALIAAVATGLVLGPAQVTLDEVWAVLTGQPARPIAQLIVGSVRLPRTITACLAGAALGVTGLAMQTLFRNPLADPFILGISSGSSLGVAAVILIVGGGGAAVLTAGLGLGGDLAVVVASAIGSGLVMALVLLLGQAVRSSVTLLLIGVMIGYLVSAGVSIMMSFSTRWGFGNYGGVTWADLPLILVVVGSGLLASLLLVKPLNALLLGERYAQSVGLNLKVVRMVLIALTSVLAGTVTAFCGPIQFLGIAVPHLARGTFNTSDHRILFPATALMGALLALTADIISGLPGDSVLPLNAAFGAPVVIWILLQRRRLAL